MFTVKLPEARKYFSIVGQKAALLSEMQVIWIPVPQGFVITSDSFNSLLKASWMETEINSMLSSIDYASMESIQETSSRIARKVVAAEIPEGILKEIKAEYDELTVGKDSLKVPGVVLEMIRAGRERQSVSVRMSIISESSVSYAGQGLTVLNVRGEKQLLESIKSCWASIFSPQFLLYRRHSGDTMPVSVALIVQRMINPEKSGQAFTANPFTTDLSRVIIEGHWGLGDIVVSGEVTPDFYMAEKQSGLSLYRKVARKKICHVADAISGKMLTENLPREKMDAQVLSDPEIRTITDVSRKAEAHFAAPLSIEWCLERGRIFVLQARPLRMFPSQEPRAHPENHLFEGFGTIPVSVGGKTRRLADKNQAYQSDEILVMDSPTQEKAFVTKPAGVIAGTGGFTTNYHWIAGDLGIPYLLGAGKAAGMLKDGDEIILDSSSGRVYSKFAKA